MVITDDTNLLKHTNSLRKSSLTRKSGMMSPDDETIIQSNKHNKRYSKDSYDSEEIKDKVVDNNFVPMPYQDETPFNLDLTNEPEESKKGNSLYGSSHHE